MKKSSRVHLTIVGALGLALAPVVSACHGSGSEPRHCVDANQLVVDGQNCRVTSGGSGSPYYWYYGGSINHTSGRSTISGGSITSSRGSSASRSGGSASSSSSTRGGFGSTARGSAGGSHGSGSAGG